MLAWHIFKKDLRLLWFFALVVAAIHFAAAALRSWLDLNPAQNQLAVIANFLPFVSLFGIAILTLVMMHQDAIPGLRQDWLVRPIKRGDLILAKLLFVIIAVQGPLLLADLGQGLGEGFALSASFSAALTRNVTVLCYLSLPAMMIGAVTRNVTESFMFALVCLIAYAVVFLGGAIMLFDAKTSVGGTGLSWMIDATWRSLAIAGTIIVISLQFFHRKTAMARCLLGAGGAAIILSTFIPWHAAFALQQRLSPGPASAHAIALAFNPQLGPFKRSAGSAASTTAVVHIPLRVTGVPADAVVLMDHADVRITDIHGKSLYAGRSNLSIDGAGSIQDAQLEVRQAENTDAAIGVYQNVFVPAAIFAKLRNQSVGMQISYSLTLFRAADSYALPASGGHENLKGLGSCSTRIDSDGDDVQVRCLSMRRLPSCFIAFLEDASKGLRNPETFVCEPDYSPFVTHLWPDAINRFGGEVPFFDRSGLARYPVDGSKLADSRLMIKTYEPRDHFIRHLNIPTIRLSDLAGPSAAPAQR